MKLPLTPDIKIEEYKKSTSVESLDTAWNEPDDN